MFHKFKSFPASPRSGAAAAFVVAVFLAVAAMLVGPTVHADATEAAPLQETDSIRVGERLTYTVSLDGFGNAGYADLSVVSRGNFEGRDAFEVRFKMKTFEVVNAAFFPVDEVRTVYLDSASGLPFALKRVVNPDGFASATLERFPVAPSGLDMTALLYKVRRAAGSGKFRLSDGESNFWVVMKARDGGVVKTDAGAFETTVSTVRSAYFKSIGISEMKIYLSTDEARVPVLVSFMTKVGLMTARLTGLRSAPPDQKEGAKPAPSPTPFPPARPVKPKPGPTKPPYIDDQPLGDDLPFALREKLTFGIRNGEVQIGKIVVEARERRQVEGKDSLFLLASVTEAALSAGVFSKDDYVKSYVDPETLLPQSSEVRFRGSLGSLNYIAKFDQEAGTALPSGSATVQIPSSTHTLLSILYAVRTFNLKLSKSAGNPVNDTRVSVFWNNQSLVFTFRPVDVQTVSVGGAKVRAQQIAVVTGNPQIDALNLKVWLSEDPDRRPLKITLGTYSAELISADSR